MVKYNKGDGVWRTIGGRRVFIKNGQDLVSAMKESGKFKNKKQEEEGKRLHAKAKQGAKDDIEQYLNGNNTNWDSDEQFIKEVADEWGIDKSEAKKMFDYQKYVHDTLNNDEYLRVNRPNEYFQKQMRESGVRTFADDIKDQEVSEQIKFMSKMNNVEYDEGFDKFVREKQLDGFSGENLKKLRKEYDSQSTRKGTWRINEQGKKEYYERELSDTERGYWTKENGRRVFKENPNYSGSGKYTVDYWKERGIEVRDTIPEGYIPSTGAITAPNGYEWYSNGKSLFGGEYEHVLVKKSAREALTDTMLNDAYIKYMKEHPDTNITLNAFKKWFK